MLKDSPFKYIFFKVKFWFVWQRLQRDPFESILQNQTIIKTVGELIKFVDTKYVIEDVDVRLIYDSVEWNKFYKDLSKKEMEKLDSYHMRIVIKSDLRYPIIITTNRDGKINEILDGLHRVKKAYMLKKKTIKSYIVPEIDLKQLKIQSDGKI